MGSVSVSPSSTVASAVVTAVPSGTIHGVLADADEDTHVRMPDAAGGGPASSMIVAIADPSIPANARIVNATAYIRALGYQGRITMTLTAGTTDGSDSLTDQRLTAFSSFTYSTWAPVSLSSSVLDPDNLALWFARTTAAETGEYAVFVAKAFVTIKYIAQPVVNVTAPSGALTTDNTPQVRWSNTLDPDGSGQFGYALKIFNDAQYGAAGFDPEASTPVFTDQDISAQTSYTLSEPLADDTYRAYVKVTQFNSEWSAWDYSAFSVAVPVPGTPTVTASPEHDLGRIKLQIAGTSGAIASNAFEAQYKDDTDNWAPLRTAPLPSSVLFVGDSAGITLDNPATLYDYESANGSAQEYRVRAIHIYGTGVTTRSAWVFRSATLMTSWWLKHPSIPTLNVPLTVASFNGQQRPVRLAVQQPLGRVDAVATQDTRGPEAGEIGIRVFSHREMETLRLIANERSPLYLQPAWDVDELDRWVLLGDESVERLIDNNMMKRRTVTYAWTKVKRPGTHHHQQTPPGSVTELGTYTEEVLADEPTLWWRLNETSGTDLADSSGNGHTGQIYSEGVVSNDNVTMDTDSLTTEDLTKSSIQILGDWDPDPPASGTAQLSPGTGFRADNYKPFVPGAKMTMECWLYKTAEESFATIFSSDGMSYPSTTAPSGQLFPLNGGVSPGTLTVASTTGFPAAGTQLRVTKTGGGSIGPMNYTSKDATHFYGVTGPHSSTAGSSSPGAAVRYGQGAPHTTWEMGVGGMMRHYADVNTAFLGFNDWGTANTGFPDSDFELNRSTHIACTFDDTTNRMEWFVNGVSQGVQGPTGYNAGISGLSVLQAYSIIDAGNFQVGFRGNYPGTGNPEVYAGLIDEIAVYETVLSPARIAAHANSGQANAGVVVPPPDIEPTEYFPFGISPGGTIHEEADYATQLNEIQAMNAKYVRFDINWAVIQRGGSSSYDWTNTDRLVDGIVARGMKPWGCIYSTPNWHKASDLDAPDAVAYYTFAATAAQRLSAKGCHVYEIWNEPNSPAFFRAAATGTQAKIDAYAALVWAAYPIVKAVDPAATIVLGGTSPAPTDVNASHPNPYTGATTPLADNPTPTAATWRVDPRDWLQGIYDYDPPGAGTNAQFIDRFDAVSAHPYSFPEYATGTSDWNSWRKMIGSTAQPSMRQIMVNEGQTAKQIWVGEYGAPTNGAPTDAFVDETVQALMTAVAMETWKTYSWAGPFCIYRARDFHPSTDGTACTTSQGHYGLIRQGGGFKQSRTNFANIAAVPIP